MSDYDRNASTRWGTSVGQSTATQIDAGLRSYMLGVYNYMTLGLGITGLFAMGLKMVGTAESATGQLMLTPIGQMLYKGPLHWVIMLAPLAFVLIFSFRIDKMSAASARNMFLAFSAVMGLSLSSILLVYTGTSVTRAFFITAGAFGGLSLYGYMTKRDLSPMGAFLVMGLIGLILAMLVNVFLQSTGFQFALSILSILIFAGLTAWDTQAIKAMYYAGDGYEIATKKSVNGALMLYLDFINIFQSVLALTGSRND
jgi:FtsH-binding integral membrane protein